jgi:hypothetical protein
MMQVVSDLSLAQPLLSQPGVGRVILDKQDFDRLREKRGIHGSAPF